MPSSDIAIAVNDLRFRIPGTERDLIEGLSFSVDKAETVLLVGSDAGVASWVIRLLFGVSFDYVGTITIEGKELRGLKRAELSKLRSNIGFVSDILPLLDDRDLLANVILPLELDAELDGTSRHSVERLLREFDLMDRATLRPSQLSVSDRAKAQIVRALVPDPQILLLDEPTLALNDQHCAEMAAVLCKQALRGMTVVVSTSDSRLAGQLPHSRTIAISEPALSAL